LVKSPSRRLGCVSVDGGELAIQRHPFFREIDWVILEERRVRPPFRPKVRSRIDTSNFDKDFTNEEPVLTPADHTSELAAVAQDVFADFDCINTDYSVMRYHTTRPSQQQPLRSVCGGLHVSNTVFTTDEPASPLTASTREPSATTTTITASSGTLTPIKTTSISSVPDLGTLTTTTTSRNASPSLTQLTISSPGSTASPARSVPSSPVHPHPPAISNCGPDKVAPKWLAE
uniref:AGC-kinase C-terminal domain-containing protein n=1 Tax=Echinostoma caproni TaxID=27848 RepID=A0A183ABE1_9TREM